ncbi:MAG: hypothetical protein O3A53_20675 [Acidobacteria bacterium]|nr:hypothetical protein [Acidobacteriota bacterium]MDA1237194.1 hypothetical protein [Acidobacteriota bacterium]
MAEGYNDKTLNIDLSGLDDEAKKLVQAAVQKAGWHVRDSVGGGIVKPASEGEIETSLEISTVGLDDDGIGKLREKVFSSEQHNKVLDAVLRGALGEYGGAAADTPFLQWVWCQWLQFSCLSNEIAQGVEAPREVFKKRYKIRPGSAGA